MNREKIHINQDRNNCFFGVGDTIEVVLVGTNEIICGKIICVDIKKQGNELHTVIDLIQANGYASIWLEGISELKIIKFDGEEKINTKYSMP